MTVIQSVIANLLTLVSLSVIFPNAIQINGISTAIMASIVLTFLNLIIRPILQLLLLPLTLITIGLFSFVINALMLELTSYFVSGFHFTSFFTAILVAIALSIINSIIMNENMKTSI